MTSAVLAARTVAAVRDPRPPTASRAETSNSSIVPPSTTKTPTRYEYALYDASLLRYAKRRCLSFQFLLQIFRVSSMAFIIEADGIAAWEKDANLLYTQCCFGVLPINFVLDLRKLCFLSKQRCHSISFHNVFYDIFGFSEFNRQCSVYSVCGQSRGYFIVSVWDVFRDLVF